MRPTFIHALTGLLLGTALAGLLNVPGQVIAHQESIPPVRSPLVAKPTQEPVVRVSPALERPPMARKTAPAKPRVVLKKVVVRTVVPRPQPTAPQPPPAPTPAVKPKPKPQPEPQPSPPAPPPPPPPPAAEPAPPKVVVGQPPADEVEDDDGKKPKKAKKPKKPKKPKKDKTDQGHEDEGEDEGEDSGKKDKPKDKEKDD